MIEAGLIAGDADVDFPASAFGGLGHEVRIGQHWPCHRYHVALAGGDELFAELRRVDAVATHYRNAHRPLDPLGRPGEGGARHHGGNGGYPGLMPADAGIDRGGASGLDALGEPDHFITGAAILQQVEHRLPIHDDEVIADRSPDLLHDRHREPHPVLEAAAPSIVSMIGMRGQELVDEIAFRAHDLDPVEARELGEGGGTREVGDGLFDLFGAHGTGLEGVDRRLYRRGCDRLGAVGVASGVNQLQQDATAGLMHALGNHPQLLGLRLGCDLARPQRKRSGLAHPDAAGDDEGGTSGGAFGIKCPQPLGPAGGFLQSGMHRTHHDPVG